MKEVKITLSNIQDIREFVNQVILVDYEVDLEQGRYVVDAKSVLGIFSLDLSKPVNVEIHADDGEIEQCDELIEQLKEFAI